MVGANPWALYIGDKIFSKSQQFDGENTSTLVFYISPTEFNSLASSPEVVLCYGTFNQPNINRDKDYKFIGKHWKLGPLEKEKLLINK